ncbi:hypothetical protein JB92DRAFT_3141257 [Gautieria morchelliformis]|nr:hypothetical protein JB92DRAFT_3141257 [Gautieria morchelliformis]
MIGAWQVVHHAQEAASVKETKEVQETVSMEESKEMQGQSAQKRARRLRRPSALRSQMQDLRAEHSTVTENDTKVIEEPVTLQETKVQDAVRLHELKEVKETAALQASVEVQGEERHKIDPDPARKPPANTSHTTASDMVVETSIQVGCTSHVLTISTEHLTILRTLGFDIIATFSQSTVNNQLHFIWKIAGRSSCLACWEYNRFRSTFDPIEHQFPSYSLSKTVINSFKSKDLAARGEEWQFTLLVAAAAAYVGSVTIIILAYPAAAISPFSASFLGASVATLIFLTLIGFGVRRTNIIESAGLALFLAYNVWLCGYDGSFPWNTSWNTSAASY